MTRWAAALLTAGALVAGSALVAAPAEAVSGPGYITKTAVRNNIHTFSVYLVASANIERFRASLQSVANDLRAAGVANLTVRAGEIGNRTSRPAGAIDVGTASSVPCGSAGNAVGCTTSDGYWRADGSTLILTSARITLLSSAPNQYSATSLKDAVAHEIGHALGLAHYTGTYGGTRQVMYPTVQSLPSYRSGDLNGLRYLAANPVPVAYIDSIVPGLRQFTIKGWAFDPDLAGGVSLSVKVDNTTVWRGTTTLSRTDVNSAYHVTGKRGFQLTLPALSGVRTICVSVTDYPTGAVRQVGCFKSTIGGTVPAVSRIAGNDVVSQPVLVSRAAFPSGAPVAFVASPYNYTETLAAGPVAAKLGGPVLTNTGATLVPTVTAELQRLKPAKIVVVGNTTAISDAVLNQLKALAPDVTRVVGADQYATGRALVPLAFPTAATLYVATGEYFADGMAAAAMAAAKGEPLLLVPGSKTALDAATRAFIAQLAPASVVVLSGASTISAGMLSSIKSVVPNTTKITGSDRYVASSLLASSSYAGTATTAYLTVGSGTIGGLTASALAGQNHGPLLLSTGTCLQTQTWAGLVRVGASKVVLLGNTGTLNATVAALRGCG